MFEDIHNLPERLNAVTAKLTSTVDTLKALQAPLAAPQKPPPHPMDELHDRITRLVGSLSEKGVAQAVDKLRSLCLPAAYPRVLATLLRLAPPDTLPAAIRAAGDDLDGAVLSVASADVVYGEDLRLVREAIQSNQGACAESDQRFHAGKILCLIPSAQRRKALINDLVASGENGEALARLVPFITRNFDDIALSTDGDIEYVLRTVEKNTICLALVGAPEPVLERVFEVMTSRAADMIREDIEATRSSGADDKSVQKARQQILDAIGKINLPASSTCNASAIETDGDEGGV